MNNKIIEYISYIIIVLLIIIITFFSTNVEKTYPELLQDLTDEPLYKFISLVIILFVTRYNTVIGILLAIVFLFTISDIGILSSVSETKENFEGPPVNSCQIYNKEKTKQIGTAFYPIN